MLPSVGYLSFCGQSQPPPITFDGIAPGAGGVGDGVGVGVDPSGGAGEQGIVVVGKSGLVLPGDGGRPQHHGYVLDDRSCKLSPDGWGRRAVQAAIDWEADDLVVERNFGGDMAVATLRTAADALGVDIPIRTVAATRGKAVRAEPVAALTAQNRWHHAGEFPSWRIRWRPGTRSWAGRRIASTRSYGGHGI
jgi:phage terminase large subunit-like protein